MKNQYIIPIFIPYLGYPNNCIFFNSQYEKDKSKPITKNDIEVIINKHLQSIKENSKVEIAFLGESIFKLDRNKQDELLTTAYEYIKQKKASSIRISTSPNYIDKNLLKRLKKYKVKTIELEVYSTNDYLLKTAGIAHSFEDIKRASKLIRAHGFTLGHQMMIGLPESTHIDEINTAKQLIQSKPKMVRIYQALVIKDTKLEKDYINGNYKVLNLIQAIETCKELVKLFAKKHIEVIRIGIQPTDIPTTSPNKEPQIIARSFLPCF